jgi:hypothetical protein
MSQDEFAPAKQSYAPLNKIYGWVAGVFIILLIADIIALLSDYSQFELLRKILNNSVVTQQEAAANDTREAIVGYVQTALFIATAVIFLAWIHRTYKNLGPLKAAGLRFTPGWAVGWFFIPFANLFRPYQVVSEIYKFSDPKESLPDNYRRINFLSSNIVGWWWGLYLLSNIVAQITLRIVLRGETASDFITSTSVSMASDAIDIIGIIVTIIMIRDISRFQDMKYKQINSPETVAVFQQGG